MAAETLLREVEEKRKREISKLESDYSAKKEEINRPIQAELVGISESARARGSELAQREQVRIEGAGKLQAKKILFDATEKMLEGNLLLLRQAFAEYASSQDYGDLLVRMAKYASSRLGDGVKVTCRDIDADKLRATGLAIVSSNLNSSGGFKAENADGSLELDLTFEEIFRNHEDELRAIIQGS